MSLLEKLGVNKNYLKPHKPCKECPFKEGSARGWFGKYKPADYHRAAHSEQLLQCHMTSGKSPEKHRHCTGVALYREKVLKVPRTKEQRDHQDECVRKYGTKGILENDRAFFKHHVDIPW